MDFRIEKKDGFKIIGQKSPIGWEYWNKFFELYNEKLEKGGYYKPPFWQVWAFQSTPENSSYPCCNTIVGAEYNGEPLIEGAKIEEYPAATWAVFDGGKEAEVSDSAGKTYARIMSEWLPLSNYVRNDNLPYLEAYWVDGTGKIEVWVPVLKK